MSDRFYCPNRPEAGLFVVEGDEARHLIQVLRASVGDRVEIFDGRGQGYQAEVRETSRNRAILAVLEGPTQERAPACHLTLATAVPKGDRFDWLVEKATEIGVETLIPITSERSVVDPGASKLERLRRKVIEASKQCGRNRLMEIGSPQTLDEILRDRSWGARLIAHPGGEVQSHWPGAETLALAIGPEGGFSEAEIDAAGALGWSVISLGANRLRIETAGLAAASVILAMASGGGL